MTPDFVPLRAASRTKLQMGHVVLITVAVEALSRWYQTVLDMDVVVRTDRLVFLTFDSFHHRLVIVQRRTGQPAELEDRHVDHIAFKVGDHFALAASYKRLKSLGIMPARSTNHGMITSLYYPDPDGTKVEFYADNFPSTDALNAWFATGAFERDPIGEDIDFERCSARLLHGEATGAVFEPPQV